MQQTTFAIGQDVWYATFDSHKTSVLCPDCGGTKKLWVTLFDGTEYEIECEGCRRGWHPPCGTVSVYEREARVLSGTIVRIELHEGKEEYYVQCGGHRHFTSLDRLAATERFARIRANSLIQRLEKEEKDRIFKKEKPTRSWAWHVHYYRKEIREAKKRIAHAETKLPIACKKAKGPVAEGS